MHERNKKWLMQVRAVQRDASSCTASNSEDNDALHKKNLGPRAPSLSYVHASPINENLSRKVLVEDAFSKVDLNGAMRNKKSTKVDLPKEISTLDILHPDISVGVRLERYKDRGQKNREDLAHRASHIVYKTLMETLNPIPNEASSKVCLEVRVAVASEGNEWVRSTYGWMIGKGYIKCVLVWCLYSYCGTVLKVGRTALCRCPCRRPFDVMMHPKGEKTTSCVNHPNHDEHDPNGAEQTRTRKRSRGNKRRQEQSEATNISSTPTNACCLPYGERFLLQNMTRTLTETISKDIHRYAISYWQEYLS